MLAHFSKKKKKEQRTILYMINDKHSILRFWIIHNVSHHRGFPGFRVDKFNVQ